MAGGSPVSPPHRLGAQCPSPPSPAGQEVRHGAEHQERPGEADHRAPAAAAHQPAGEPPGLPRCPPRHLGLLFLLLCLRRPHQVSWSRSLKDSFLGRLGSSLSHAWPSLTCLLSAHGPSLPLSVALPAPEPAPLLGLQTVDSGCPAPVSPAAQLMVQRVGAFLPAPGAWAPAQAPTPAVSPDHLSWGPGLRGQAGGASVGPCSRPVARGCYGCGDGSRARPTVPGP